MNVFKTILITAAAMCMTLVSYADNCTKQNNVVTCQVKSHPTASPPKYHAVIGKGSAANKIVMCISTNNGDSYIRVGNEAYDSSTAKVMLNGSSSEHEFLTLRPEAINLPRPWYSGVCNYGDYPDQFNSWQKTEIKGNGGCDTVSTWGEGSEGITGRGELVWLLDQESGTSKIYLESEINASCISKPWAVGSNGTDYIYGTSLDDILSGYGGVDYIYGYGGDDFINGHEWRGDGVTDYLYGGSGYDTCSYQAEDYFNSCETASY